MAIRDLLWACPLCGAVGGLRRAGKGDACASCGASFRRAGGSRIEARLPDGWHHTRPSQEWAERLPAEPPGPRRDRVVARFAIGDEAIRLGGAYLGSMERLGPAQSGELTLTDEALELRLDEGGSRRWPLATLSALQASSGTVQVRPRGQPIVSLAFPESSARLWEESIAAALRACWRSLGRGEIVEYQPRIVGRRDSAARTAPPAPPATPGGASSPAAPGDPSSGRAT